MTAIFIACRRLQVFVAKKGARKWKKYLRGEINDIMDLGTLGPAVASTKIAPDSVTEKAWLSSVVLTWALAQFTPTTNVGPIMVGVAHSDYAASEIEEWIENLGSWEEGDKIAQEKAKRKIRKVGIFPTPASATQVAVLNDGKPIRTKCGWQLATGQSVRIWAYNRGSVAIATTDPDLVYEGHANLWPN